MISKIIACSLPRNAKIKSEKPYFSAFVSHETEAERFKK